MEAKIQQFITTLTKKTIREELFWAPISELSTTESGFPDIVGSDCAPVFYERIPSNSP